MIEHLTVKFAAALAALAVLAAGSATLLAHADVAAGETLRRSADSLASAVDHLSRQDSEGSLLLTGDDGVLPHTLRGSPFVITFGTASLALTWGGRTATAGLSTVIDPTVGLQGHGLVLGSELSIWAVRIRAPGLLTTVEVR